MSDAVSNDFRTAMRRLATTVSVISVERDDQRNAMTATAVTSLSMDPPSLLVCVNSRTKFHGILSASDLFCVNILHEHQHPFSNIFAKPVSDEEFKSVTWSHFGDYCYLPNSQASVMCRKAGEMTFGTHTIFIGTVENVVLRDDSAPLIFHDGKYGRCSPFED